MVDTMEYGVYKYGEQYTIHKFHLPLADTSDR